MPRQYRTSPQAGRTFVSSWSRGHRYPSPSTMSMAARRSTSPPPSSSCTRSTTGPSPRAPQRLLVAGREVDEPGYQGGEGAELIAARSDPGRLGPARLACGELGEVVASVPVAIRSGEPHGGDRAEPDGARALQARLERGAENQVPAAAERQPGQHVRLGVGERRAEYLPGRSAAVVHPVAGRADDLPGRGGGTGAHRDVPGPQRLPRLAERLLPRFIQSRPDPRRSSRRRRAGDPPHESGRPRILQATGPGPVTAGRLTPGYLHS